MLIYKLFLHNRSSHENKNPWVHFINVFTDESSFCKEEPKNVILVKVHGIQLTQISKFIDSMEHKSLDWKNQKKVCYLNIYLNLDYQ